jgi:hypothetical protein
MKGKPSPAILAAAILVIGFAAMLALNLPGQLSYDSVSQLLDGRSASYNSWHPAVMAWLLGLFDALLPGTALYLIFEAGLLALALGLLLSRRANWGAPLVALGLVLTPQFLLFQGTVWKDVLFADAFVLAFALLARAVRATKTSWPLLALFFASMSLAALARQNGLVLLPVGAATFGWSMARGDLRRGLLAGAMALGLLLALVWGAGVALALRGDHGEGLGGEIQLGQIYDLTGAVKNGYRMDLLSQSDPELARAIETQGAKAYSLQMQDTLEPFLPAQIAKGAVMAEWRALILRHTALYLEDRLAVFWQVVATPNIGLCHPAYAGIEGEPDQLKALGLSARIRPQDIKLATYARSYMGTPILSHLAFAGLGLGLLVFYLSRRSPPDIAMAGLIMGAFAFAATFFFVSVACDYRYLYPLDMAVMLAFFQFFASPARR